MEDKNKNLIYIANIQRAFVATIMQALSYHIQDMLEYCKKNNIHVDSFEYNQLKIMDKALRNITSDYKVLRKDKANAFKQYSKIMAVVIQQLFSKTDGDYMTMFKFYNYVKTFTTTRKEIEVPANKEADAFAVIFGNHNSNNN